MKEAPRFEIDFSQKDQSEIVHEEPFFQEKINVISAQYEEFLSMEQRGISPKEENVDDSFVSKRREQLEDEYISLVCECSPEEYEKWKENTLDRLMCGLIQAQIRELTGRKERDKFEIEKLFSVFALYMTAKDKRETE